MYFAGIDLGSTMTKVVIIGEDDEISYIIATGYGRINVPFADRQITELTCHARGVASFFPGVRLAIDIGGQDAKGLKVRDGKLIDFVRFAIDRAIPPESPCVPEYAAAS